MINDTSLESFTDNLRDGFDDTAAAHGQGASQAHPARKQVVKGEPDSVKGFLPPSVVTDYKTLVLNQVWGIPEEVTPLAKCFPDQGYISLLKVANTSVNKLGAARRCALCKVTLFKQQGLVTPGDSICCHTKTGSTSSDDNEIPLMLFVFQIL